MTHGLHPNILEGCFLLPENIHHFWGSFPPKKTMLNSKRKTSITFNHHEIPRQITASLIIQTRNEMEGYRLLNPCLAAVDHRNISSCRDKIMGGCLKFARRVVIFGWQLVGSMSSALPFQGFVTFPLPT